jgi:hypothetical protein
MPLHQAGLRQSKRLHVECARTILFWSLIMSAFMSSEQSLRTPIVSWKLLHVVGASITPRVTESCLRLGQQDTATSNKYQLPPSSDAIPDVRYGSELADIVVNASLNMLEFQVCILELV